MLVDKPSLCGKQFLYAGGVRGGKARLESDQMSRKALPCKACVEHPKGTCFGGGTSETFLFYAYRSLSKKPSVSVTLPFRSIC